MLCLGSLEAFASQIGPDQYKESLIQINFPDTVPLETSPSHDLMSLSIYRSLNVKEVQSQKQEVMDLNSLPLKIQYNHYKKKITFENNNLTCEERSFYGASLRMNYSCQIEVDPRWLIPSS